ncbi:uncharacterized protein ABDE67_020337 [Symphorus nematophorus]
MEHRKALRKEKHLERPLVEEEAVKQEDYSSSSLEDIQEPLRRKSRQLSSSSNSSTSSITTTSTSTHLTIYRRKKRAGKDREVLAKAQQELLPQGTTRGTGGPCGHPRHLETGRTFCGGEFFCSMEEGRRKDC